MERTVQNAEQERRDSLFRASAEFDLANRMAASRKSPTPPSPHNPVDPNAEKLDNTTMAGILSMRLAMMG